MSVKLKLSQGHSAVSLSVYAPPLVSTDEEKDAFCSNLNDAISAYSHFYYSYCSYCSYCCIHIFVQGYLFVPLSLGVLLSQYMLFVY